MAINYRLFFQKFWNNNRLMSKNMLITCAREKYKNARSESIIRETHYQSVANSFPKKISWGKLFVYTCDFVSKKNQSI